LNLFEYAFYRHVGKLMTVDELLWALELAERAEAGEGHARQSLERLIDDVWADAANRETRAFP
jgi:hypothetical protein